MCAQSEPIQPREEGEGGGAADLTHEGHKICSRNEPIQLRGGGGGGAADLAREGRRICSRNEPMQLREEKEGEGGGGTVVGEEGVMGPPQ